MKRYVGERHISHLWSILSKTVDQQVANRASRTALLHCREQVWIVVRNHVMGRTIDQAEESI
jgi:hypothetical protein